MSSNTTSIPYSWIKHISPKQAELETIPRMGYPPAFPWENLASKLAEHFEVKDLHLEASEPQWRQQEDLYAGLGEPLSLFHGVLAPLEGSWTWAMPEQDVSILMALLLSKQQTPLDIPNQNFREGFARFLALETLNLIEQLGVDKELSPRLSTKDESLEAPAYSTDVTIKLFDKHFVGRFLLSRDLHQALKERYSQRGVNVSLSPTMAQKLQVAIHLEVGKTTLSVKDWSSISLGDLILLDKCSVTPGEQKGRVMLTLNGNPLFRGMIKPGGIKILESPQYYEVEETMAKNNSEDDKDFEEEEDLESEFDEDLDLSDEETEEEDIAEGEEDSELEYSEEAEEESEGAEKKQAPQSAEPAKGLERGKPIGSVNELPMTVIVEVGRLQMTVQQLMDLQPGNMLDLDTHPENGVDLVVNQKLIGKGELVLVGETIGVRILDLGTK